MTRDSLPTTEYLTPMQAAVYLNVAVRTLTLWRKTHGGPPFIRLGGGPQGRVRYARATLDEWMMSQQRQHSGAALAGDTV